MEKILNLINGQLVEPASESYIDNYNPSTGKVYSLKRLYKTIKYIILSD